MVVLAPHGGGGDECRGRNDTFVLSVALRPLCARVAHFGDDARYRYRFGREKVSLMRSIDLLVIDEISMVRADLLDAVDEVLRRYRDRSKPFGGVQLLMIGDLAAARPWSRSRRWRCWLRIIRVSTTFSAAKALAQAGM